MNNIENFSKNRKIAVLISGRGSNLFSLIKSSLNNKFNGSIALVISDKISAKGINYAKKYNITSHIIDSDDNENNLKFYEKLLDTIKSHNIDIICLAGFMKILPENFIQNFHGPIINIHPSLLPKYKGLNTHQRAIDNGDSHAGCTVHHVTKDLDAGEIILQKSIKINYSDTAESLSTKVLELENQTYSEALKKIIN